MIKSRLISLISLCLLVILHSCNSSTNNVASKNKPVKGSNKNPIEKTVVNGKTQIEIRSLEFVKHIKSQKKLSSFFCDKWIFIYHDDNRCDGSTDGQIENLRSTQIDSIIRLSVKNDGEAWACDKKEPSTYEFSFDLKKIVSEWDRCEMANYDSNEDKNIVYVLGAGETEYLILYYNSNNLINKFEYRSEDPG